MCCSPTSRRGRHEIRLVKITEAQVGLMDFPGAFPVRGTAGAPRRREVENRFIGDLSPGPSQPVPGDGCESHCPGQRGRLSCLRRFYGPALRRRYPCGVALRLGCGVRLGKTAPGLFCPAGASLYLHLPGRQRKWAVGFLPLAAGCGGDQPRQQRFQFHRR